MKFFIFFYLLFFISCSESSNRKNTFSKSNFSNDSGYIIKKEATSLIANFFKDSISSSYNQLADEDTVGKYYTSISTGNIIVCVIDPGEEFYGRAHILIEIQHVAGRDSILVCERYRHGSYPCCWKDFNGFKRIGNYFYFRSCGTGSGFCSGSIYLFRELLPETEQNPIMETIFSQYGEEYQKLSSEMQLQGNSVTMHYQLQTNLHQPGTTQSKHRTQKFTVRYTLQQNQWVADDSTNLKGLIY